MIGCFVKIIVLKKDKTWYEVKEFREKGEPIFYPSNNNLQLVTFDYKKEIGVYKERQLKT